MDTRLVGNEDFSPAGSREKSFIGSHPLVRGGSFLSGQREKDAAKLAGGRSIYSLGGSSSSS